jgi:hypothetical protein
MLDREGLRARLLSSSYIPAAGLASYEPMLAALEGLFEEHQRNGKRRDGVRPAPVRFRIGA